MKIPRKIFSDLTKVLLAVGAWKVTKYYTDKDVVTATRRCYGRKIDKRDTRVEILFKVGGPNFVKRIQIKYLPKKK